jgi:hypothetical protein
MNTLEWPEITGFSQYARLLHIPIRASFASRSIRPLADEMGKPRALVLRRASNEFCIFSRIDSGLGSGRRWFRNLGVNAIRHLLNNGGSDCRYAAGAPPAKSRLGCRVHRKPPRLPGAGLRGILQLDSLARSSQIEF